MLRYVLTRLGQSLLTIFLTISAVFVLVRLAPGDPAYAFAGPTATAEQLQQVRDQMGLGDPIWVQYGAFLSGLVRGDLGTSFSFHQPALDVVLARVPNTITLAAAAILLAAVIAIPLGVHMARTRDRMSEVGLNVLTITGQSMPDFWIGIMLLTVFAVTFPILPTSGFTSWAGIVLPATTIAILQIALFSRMVRSEMVGALAAPYSVVARSRGIKGSALVWGYAMRNSGVPIVTALGTRFASMLNGVVVVEVVFGWPGIGSLVVRALETRDYPLIQATVIVTACMTVIVQLLVDLCYPMLDPRVRLDRKGAA